MALDPHPDREPGMDARVVIREVGPTTGETYLMGEFAKSVNGEWCSLGHGDGDYAWADLAAAYPDAVVVLP